MVDTNSLRKISKQELLLKQGDEEERISAYCTDRLHQELVTAMVNAAHEINKKCKGRKRGSLRKIFKNKISKTCYDEIVIDEDVISTTDQNNCVVSEIKSEDGGLGGSVYCIIFPDTLDAALKSQWFLKTVTMFRRLQIIKYFGVFEL